jgi:hypothetical protein
LLSVEEEQKTRRVVAMEILSKASLVMKRISGNQVAVRAASDSSIGQVIVV